MDEERAREYYVKLHTLKQHEKQLAEHTEELDAKTVELRNMIEAVQEIPQAQPGDDILLPLTNGIFIKATLKETDKLYLNIGADTVITKTPEETQTILEKQQAELTEYRQKLTTQHQALLQEITRLEQEVHEQMKDHV